jgi:hypothetical protein
MRLLCTLVILAAAANAADTVFVEKQIVVRDTVHDTVLVAAPYTAYQQHILELGQRTVDALERPDWGQIAVVIISISSGLVGYIFSWIRNRAREERQNEDMFRSFLERFTDRSQDSSVRIASCIGLQHVSTKRSRIDKRKQPYLARVTHLLVESVFTEDHPDVRNTIRDQLIEIGGPALQTLVNRHREKFPTNDPKQWYSVMPAALALRLTNLGDPVCAIKPEDLPTNYIASRDAIAGIIKKAEPGNLARPFDDYESEPMPASIHQKAERWLDKYGLSDISLVGVNLSGAYLEQAYLGRAHMEYANLTHAYMEHTYLGGAYMGYASLNEAYMRHANLSVARMEYANLDGANMEHVSLEWARMEHANVIRAILRDATLIDEADWTGCNWWDAKGIPEDAAQRLAAEYTHEDNEPRFLEYWTRLSPYHYRRDNT